MAAPLWWLAHYCRSKNLAQRRTLRGGWRDAAGLLFHAFARHPHLDARVLPSLDAEELHLARRSDRRAAQARRDTGVRETVYGGIEAAGDRERFSRAPVGVRQPSAGRDRGQDTNRADLAAVGVGGATVDRMREPGEPFAFAWRGARPRNCGAGGAWSRSRKTGRAIPHREPGARRTRHNSRAGARCTSD